MTANQPELETFYKHPDETVRVGIDFGKWLRSGETLSSPSIESVTPSGELTATNEAVNTVVFNDKEGTLSIAANEGVCVDLAAGNAGKLYLVVIKATSSVSPDLPAVTLPVQIVG